MRAAHDPLMSLGSLREGHRASRCVFAATCVALVSILDSRIALAADEQIMLPLYDVPTPMHGPAPVDHGTEPTAAGAQPGNTRPLMELRRTSTSFTMVELPPETALPGSTYKRPHHAFGYRWQAAESWLRDHGFDAQTCYLPMVRMHTKLSATGAAGTLWVYGRCTFR